jgi:bacillithiol biosynthesis deacetylase BshB1
MPLEFFDKPLDVLVIAPHPDDAEISVGGTILQSLADGLTVGILDLTSGEPTPHGTVERRVQETETASGLLGLTWRANLGLPNRSLQNTLDARRAVAEVFRQAKPGIILAPFATDAHPDHVAASQLVDDARFWSKLSRTDMAGERFWPPKLYHYWSIHLRIHPQLSFVVDISDHIERKLDAVRAFESQVSEGRSQEFPNLIDDVHDRARYWGWAIGSKYGEPFGSHEEIGVAGLNALA